MSTMNAPTPVLVAFIVCDQVIQDRLGGKHTLVGIFSNITAERFPATHKSPWLYAKMIDCEGNYDIRVEFVKVSTQDVLIEGGGSLAAADRHTSVEFVSLLPNLPLPSAGEYEFRLWMNEKFISNVRITAIEQAPR